MSKWIRLENRPNYSAFINADQIAWIGCGLDDNNKPKGSFLHMSNGDCFADDREPEDWIAKLGALEAEFSFNPEDAPREMMKDAQE